MRNGHFWGQTLFTGALRGTEGQGSGIGVPSDGTFLPGEIEGLVGRMKPCSAAHLTMGQCSEASAASMH